MGGMAILRKKLKYFVLPENNCSFEDFALYLDKLHISKAWFYAITNVENGPGKKTATSKSIYLNHPCYSIPMLMLYLCPRGYHCSWGYIIFKTNKVTVKDETFICVVLSMTIWLSQGKYQGYYPRGPEEVQGTTLGIEAIQFCIK